jgi:hypothetical protein
MSKWFMISLAGVFMIGTNVLIASQLPIDANNKTTFEGNETQTVKSSKEVDQITLHYQTYEKDRQGPVGFSHLKHAREYQISCWECHHEYGNGEKNTWAPWGITEKCIKCHEPNRKKNGVIKLMTAFHLNCKVCHKKRDIYEGDAKSYKDCGKCHLNEILIENQGYEKNVKGPVTFQHRKHENEYLNLNGERIACEACHHEYVNGTNIWSEGDNVKNCGAKGCHAPITGKGQRQLTLRIAYHKNCKNCHKALREPGKSEDAPYKKCSACHRFPK